MIDIVYITSHVTSQVLFCEIHFGDHSYILNLGTLISYGNLVSYGLGTS